MEYSPQEGTCTWCMAPFQGADLGVGAENSVKTRFDSLKNMSKGLLKVRYERPVNWLFLR